MNTMENEGNSTMKIFGVTVTVKSLKWASVLGGGGGSLRTRYKNILKWGGVGKGKICSLRRRGREGNTNRN